MAMGRPLDALDALDDAIALSPFYTEAKYNRANALKQLDRFEDARNAYRDVLELECNHPGALHNLGNTLKHLGDTSGALICYQRKWRSTLNTQRPTSVTRL